MTWDNNAEPPLDFNWAVLKSIGKISTESLDTGEQVYTPESTRPISIVDAPNRIIASILRVALERAVSSKISSMQRGFLRGRSMLRNIVEIDWTAHKVSVLSSKGVISLFDFKAAFPSIDHTFM